MNGAVPPALAAPARFEEKTAMFRLSAVIACAGLALSGCTSTEVLVAHSVPLEKSTQAIPEPELLDVGVNVFDPGVPEGEIEREVQEELIEDGTFVQIRRAESMYLAVELRDTLQESSHWGAVWVTPDDTTAADVNLDAEILESDGSLVRLHVKATDATGRVWIDDEYTHETAAGAFNSQRYPNLDPYQDLLNRISNDLAEARADLSGEQARDLRRVASLRYAGELTPAAFGDYVVEDSDRYELARLPAENDPVYARTQQVRQRERLFLETLNQHYASFANEAEDSYDRWREYSREEAIAIRELTRSARWRTGMGIATILASVVYGSNSNNDSFSDRVIRDAMMYIGVDMLRTSAVRRQEKRLHSESLEELATSFSDDVEPLVVEIQGTEHRLTGTAEVQYREWRDLLRRMVISERGFDPDEMQIYRESSSGDAPAEDTVPADSDSDSDGAQQVSSDAGGSGASGA